MLSGVSLRIVPIESVRPHEIADPAREARIERRIRQDGVLRDPLLVGTVPDVEGYVLLDGTNRRLALERLGLPGTLVQVTDYADPRVVELKTWCHAAPIPITVIVSQARAISGIEVEPLSPLAAPDALADSATLAVLLDHRARYVLTRQPRPAETRSRQLRHLVDLYEDRMVRVDCDADSVEGQAYQLRPDETLIAFPRFTRAQVVALAMQGTPIPAGITRHVILAGRVLRVNLSLEMLRLAGEPERAEDALRRHLADLTPRLYQEPTILFDS